MSAPCACTTASFAASASNLLGAVTKGRPGELGDLLRHPLGVALRGVEARAHRGAAERELVQVRQRALQVAQRLVDLRDVPAELLAQRERGRVLQVRAADLHHALEGLRLLRERVAQRLHLRHHAAHHRLHRRDAHRGGEHVVGALALVHVVVGVDLAALAALAAQQLGGAVRQHLVDVHVRLGAAAGLPDDERELLVVLAREHLVRGLHDGLAALLGERAVLHVHDRRRLLHQHQRADERHGHALAGDVEVLPAALRLGAPQPVGGDLDGAEGVLLDAYVLGAHGGSLLKTGKGWESGPWP